MSKGQSLFEVVVALAISALVIVALVSLVSSSIRNANFAKNKSQASNYAQELSEWLRGQRDNDPITFFTNTQTPSWCMNNLSWTSPGACPSGTTISGAIYMRSVSFIENVEAGKSIVEASVEVSWSDSQGLHKVSSVTNFSDWRDR